MRRLIAVFAIALVFAILMGLGLWQVQRLHWKTALLADLDRAYSADRQARPLTLDDFRQADRDNRLFIGGTITGTPIPGDRMLIGPRTRDDRVGYHLYMPVRLETGGTVLVNFGWVPEGWTYDSLPALKTPLNLPGFARRPDRPNSFTPSNDPAHDRWYSVDLALLQSKPALKTLPPYVFYAMRPMAEAALWPVPFAKDWRPPNNHLGYALFWFTMAGLLLAITAIKIGLLNGCNEKPQI